MLYLVDLLLVVGVVTKIMIAYSWLKVNGFVEKSDSILIFRHLF